MIREELIHPALAHFPIACLILVFFTKLTQIIVMKRSREVKEKLEFTTQFLLFFGCAMLLPTLFLGDIAFDLVKADLCNIVKAYEHEESAHNTLYIFIFAMILELSLRFENVKKNYELLIQVSLLLVITFGNIVLVQTSHQGGELVYEQGAAVRREFSVQTCEWTMD